MSEEERRPATSMKVASVNPQKAERLKFWKLERIPTRESDFGLWKDHLRGTDNNRLSVPNWQERSTAWVIQWKWTAQNQEWSEKLHCVPITLTNILIQAKEGTAQSVAYCSSNYGAKTDERMAKPQNKKNEEAKSRPQKGDTAKGQCYSDRKEESRSCSTCNVSDPSDSEDTSMVWIEDPEIVVEELRASFATTRRKSKQAPSTSESSESSDSDTAYLAVDGGRLRTHKSYCK